MKSVFANHGGVKLEVETNVVPATDQVSVTITSKYAEAKNPEDARRLLQLTLSKNDLHDLVFHLGAQLAEVDPEVAADPAFAKVA